MRKFATPFTSFNGFGNVADCLKVRLHNQSSSKQRTGPIIAFLAIIICSPDTPSSQEIQIKPPDVLRRGWAQDYIAPDALPSICAYTTV